MRLPDPATSMAILVGCAAYSDLPALPAVSAGLLDLKAALTDPASGGFTPGTCQVIAEPRDLGLLGPALVKVARTTQDTLLVYYSGHGVLDENNNLYLALTSTSSEQALVPDTALPFSRIRDILRNSPANNKIVILDCCFAGRAIHSMAGPDLSAQAVINGSYVLTATDADKTALAPGGARHTAFTGALINLLRDGIPEGPDLLTLEVIYPHLHQALVGSGLPEPHQQGTDTVAGLALTRNRRTPLPVPAPGRLVAASSAASSQAPFRRVRVWLAALPTMGKVGLVGAVLTMTSAVIFAWLATNHSDHRAKVGNQAAAAPAVTVSSVVPALTGSASPWREGSGPFVAETDCGPWAADNDQDRHAGLRVRACARRVGKTVMVGIQVFAQDGKRHEYQPRPDVYTCDGGPTVCNEPTAAGTNFFDGAEHVGTIEPGHMWIYLGQREVGDGPHRCTGIRTPLPTNNSGIHYAGSPFRLDPQENTILGEAPRLTCPQPPTWLTGP